MKARLEFGRTDEPLELIEVPEDRRTSWSVEADFIGAVRDALGVLRIVTTLLLPVPFDLGVRPWDLLLRGGALSLSGLLETRSIQNVVARDLAVGLQVG